MQDQNLTFPGVLELKGRTLLRFSGADQLRYLNGQITNDVAKASPSEAIYACVTDAKGKLQADIYVRELPDGRYLIDAAGELRESLSVRLERYIIADDVEMEDVSDSYKVFHFMDGDAGSGLNIAWTGDCARFGSVGRDVIVSTEIIEDSSAVLRDRLGDADPDLVESVRIRNGVPTWGRELTEGMLPPEARIEERAINYEKGCYIGQEVISRIKSAGKVNRMLCRIRVIEGTAVVGDKLCVEKNGESVRVGEITSVAIAANFGLGYVKRNYSGMALNLCGVNRKVELY